MLSMILELGRGPHPSPLTDPKNGGNQNVFNDSEVGGINGNQKDIMGFHVLSKGRVRGARITKNRKNLMELHDFGKGPTPLPNHAQP